MNMLRMAGIRKIRRHKWLDGESTATVSLFELQAKTYQPEMLEQLIAGRLQMALPRKLVELLG